MKKIELKRLARNMASDFLRGVLEEDALEIGLEVRNIFLSEEEFKNLANEMQQVVERLERNSIRWQGNSCHFADEVGLTHVD